MLRITVLGARKTTAQLEAMRRRASDLAPVLRGSARKAVQGEVRKNFQAQGSPTRWASRKSGGDWPILRKTGRLMGDAIAGRVEAGKNYMVYIVTNPYAGFHQWGTRRMVARPVVRTTTALMRGLTRAIGEYISKGGT